MMARRLPVQVVDDELVTGLLQIGAIRPPMVPSPTNPTTMLSLAIASPSFCCLSSSATA
jgi:hypothetical protein